MNHEVRKSDSSRIIDKKIALVVQTDHPTDLLPTIKQVNDDKLMHKLLDKHQWHRPKPHG